MTRRAALKKLRAGLAGMALACFGLANKASAATRQGYCQVTGAWYTNDLWYSGLCVDTSGCVFVGSGDCPPNGTLAGSVSRNWQFNGKFKAACGYLYSTGTKCSFTL